MPVEQVYSSQEVDFGNYVKMFWVQGFSGDGSVVPPHKVLEVTTITLNYFPSGEGSIGRLDISGRNAPDLSTGTAMWRLQAIYIDPRKTVHLTFPIALRLESGGHVEIGFTAEGPGTILAEANGVLVSH